MFVKKIERCALLPGRTPDRVVWQWWLRRCHGWGRGWSCHPSCRCGRSCWTPQAPGWGSSSSCGKGVRGWRQAPMRHCVVVVNSNWWPTTVPTLKQIFIPKAPLTQSSCFYHCYVMPNRLINHSKNLKLEFRGGNPTHYSSNVQKTKPFRRQEPQLASLKCPTPPKKRLG